jgi:hypothetical protein
MASKEPADAQIDDLPFSEQEAAKAVEGRRA